MIDQDYTRYEPCPQCGSTDLIQHAMQSEDVKLSGDGEIREFIPRGPPDVREVWCTECDEKLWEREE